MKKRIILALLFTLLCLGLAALPAMAAPGPQLLFQSGTPYVPELPSPVGFPIGPTAIVGDQIPSVSWNCSFADCNVEGMTIFAFVDQPTGGPPTPTSVQVQLSQKAFDFTDVPPSFGFTVPGSSIFGIGPCLPTEGALCIQELSLNFNHSYDAPGGTNWISLFAMQGNAPSTTLWSNAGGVSSSTTLTLDLATGVVSGYPSPLAFQVFGTPTVPEPSSMIMLGSGVLGLAGVLRRKLMR